MKRLVALSLALCLLLCGCEGEMLARLHARLAPGGTGDAGDWVIFVYLCGSDLESVDGSASLDLAEMQEVSFDGRLTFVAMTGGAGAWKSSAVSADELAVWQVDGSGMRQLATFPNASMGDEATFAQFLTYCAENFSGAAHRGLVLWNHGGGPLDGVCFDEQFGDDSLLLPELAGALETGGMTYDFIGFDACLMATAETAAVCAPYTDYLIASEETEAGLGWAYRDLGDAICVEHQSMPALGQTICDDYYASCAWLGEQALATMSVLDLTKLPALAAALDTAAEAIAQADAESFGNYARLCAQAQNFGGNSPEEGYTNLVDLGGILSGLSPVLPAAADAAAALDALVVYSVAGSGCEGATGLSVYYPLSPDGVHEVERAGELALCPGWASLLRRLGAGASGGGAVTIRDAYFDDDGYYTLQLDPETLDNLAVVAFDLYRETEDGYACLGRDDAVYVDWETGLVQDNFDGTWLFLPDGQLLPYTLTESGEQTSRYSAPVLLNGTRATLLLEYDWENGGFSVLGVSEDGAGARSVRPLEAGDAIAPVYAVSDTLDGAAVREDPGEPLRAGQALAVQLDSLPEGNYDYRFRLTDIYGVETTTNFAQFYVDENGEVWY